MSHGHDMGVHGRSGGAVGVRGGRRDATASVPIDRRTLHDLTAHVHAPIHLLGAVGSPSLIP